MPRERFTVRVTKDYLVFCSGHFITYEGSECERLHGHNYRVAVEVVAPLDENHYVFDFIALKNIMRKLTDELDHYMLLPTKSKLIRVEATEKSVRAAFRDKEWIFPKSDCVLLPIPNTTAELLAKYLTDRLLEEIRQSHGFVPDICRMEVEESFGQVATYEFFRTTHSNE
ncbi:MAG: 6-pyruvoyl tetrahydropterin synthase family protein [Gemmataceae bacterium]|jgi:6-pyruvoyltetrahydropterin/6-carboxytetrahydropterin synthase|nr:6-pyruvoyl tetrahydropterin synthase family protein [Gemmataceae bacterium]